AGRVHAAAAVAAGARVGGHATVGAGEAGDAAARRGGGLARAVCAAPIGTALAVADADPVDARLARAAGAARRGGAGHALAVLAAAHRTAHAVAHAGAHRAVEAGPAARPAAARATAAPVAAVGSHEVALHAGRAHDPAPQERRGLAGIAAAAAHRAALRVAHA